MLKRMFCELFYVLSNISIQMIKTKNKYLVFDGVFRQEDGILFGILSILYEIKKCENGQILQ